MSTENESPENSPLPAEKMPECWKEEERMNALYSPVRSKSVNPEDWRSKYKFWRNLIYEWLKYRMRGGFTILDLNEAFKRKGCSPSCLKNVVEELLRNNEIVEETEFLKEPADSWTAWSIDIFIKKPFTWSFSMVKSYVVNSENCAETRYIHLQIVRELGDTIYSILEQKKEYVLVPFSNIVKCCKCNTDNSNISDNTAMLALIWLRRAKKVTFKKSTCEDELLVKIITPSTNNVTDVEEALYALIKQENELMKEIQVMEEKKLNIINEAKSYLAKGLRQMAKAHLKQKVKLEQAIEKRSNVLANLQSLILSIQDVHSNSYVLSAYKVGSSVLKKLSEGGLTESNVKEIMDDLSESLEEHKEVQSMLSESLAGADTDPDLEAELAELMREDERAAVKSDTNLNSTIEELEETLNNLHFEDSALPENPPLKSQSEGNKKKKKLADAQYR